MAKVVNILLHHTETLPPRPVEDAVVSPNGGLVGDSHDGRRQHRQVLLTDAQLLSQLGLAPGDLREQITVEGLAVDGLAEGTKVAIGDAVAVVQGECAPCFTIGGYLGEEDVEAFRDKLIGKRGTFVLFDEASAGTSIAVGDEVKVLEPAQS